MRAGQEQFGQEFVDLAKEIRLEQFIKGQFSNAPDEVCEEAMGKAGDEYVAKRMVGEEFGNPGAWVKKVARNRAIDVLRKPEFSQRAEVADWFEVGDAAPPFEEGVEDRLETGQAWARLMQFVDTWGDSSEARAFKLWSECFGESDWVKDRLEREGWDYGAFRTAKSRAFMRLRAFGYENGLA